MEKDILEQFGVLDPFSQKSVNTTIRTRHSRKICDVEVAWLRLWGLKEMRGSLAVAEAEESPLRISPTESLGICGRRNDLSADLAKRYFSYSFSGKKMGLPDVKLDNREWKYFLFLSENFSI
ncbi:hypothetical protein NPIL_613641 [Nephila pilipes]|uniref:Uncharacterized protein n=1 Tax=Nephila pilipes TaxID=299642 RepID=A0A8X6QLW3_NEPPI|nr:hypothetical protein NPIL_613641 [Nephila pilipes]